MKSKLSEGLSQGKCDPPPPDRSSDTVYVRDPTLNRNKPGVSSNNAPEGYKLLKLLLQTVSITVCFFL